MSSEADVLKSRLDREWSLIANQDLMDRARKSLLEAMELYQKQRYADAEFLLKGALIDVKLAKGLRTTHHLIVMRNIASAVRAQGRVREAAIWTHWATEPAAAQQESPKSSARK